MNRASLWLWALAAGVFTFTAQMGSFTASCIGRCSRGGRC
jgi:hypothetical protein